MTRPVESGGQSEYVLAADVDTTAAASAVLVEDYRMALAHGLERRPDHLGFRADGEAVHAIVAGAALVGGDTKQCGLAHEAVEGAHRTNVATPAAACQQEVVEENTDHDPPRQAESEDQPAVKHRYRIDPFPCDATCGKRGDECEAEEPVTGIGMGRLATLDAQPAPQPGGGIGDDVDRADPGTEKTAAEQQIEGKYDAAAENRFPVRRVTRCDRLQQNEGVGERKHAEGEAGRKVSLDQPQPEPWADQEQQQDRELTESAQQQPLVGLEPALTSTASAPGRPRRRCVRRREWMRRVRGCSWLPPRVEVAARCFRRRVRGRLSLVHPRIAISASFKAAHRKLLLLADQRATRGFLLFPALR